MMFVTDFDCKLTDTVTVQLSLESLKGGFHVSSNICVIYSPVYAFWRMLSFSLFLNQSQISVE